RREQLGAGHLAGFGFAGRLDHHHHTHVVSPWSEFSGLRPYDEAGRVKSTSPKMRPCAMGIPLFRSPPGRHFAWLLWLALLLPVAQAAAACHALSHAATASDERDNKQLLHEGHCDLCLIGAALGGGALTGAAPASPHPAVRHEAPPAAAVACPVSSPVRAYLSRA